MKSLPIRIKITMWFTAAILVVIFFTYSHYFTYAGLALGIRHAIFVPLAHDEPGIYVSLYKKVFENARAFLFNTEEERKFVCKQFGIDDKPYRVTCIGIDLPRESTDSLPEQYKKYTNYIIYVGRVAHSKNYAELNKYFIEYNYFIFMCKEKGGAMRRPCVF